MDLKPGLVLGNNFRLESLLGEGGMGAVWKATDVSLGRVVALKVLHTDLRSDANLLGRFQREAQLLASVEHPVIVPIYTWLTIQDEAGGSFPCIVMPFVKGRPLADMIRTQGPLSLSQSVTILKPLLEALGSAHEAGIVHRDLKPQNIMLEERSSGLQVRLLDFGIAKSLNAETAPPGTAMRTQAGILLGTPDYMSPEQISNPGAVDGRADLWAITVCLFEMLTQHTPFPGATPLETISRVLTQAPLSAHALNPRLPPSLNDFFRRTLSPQLQDRPATAVALVQALEALQQSDPGMAEPSMITPPPSVPKHTPVPVVSNPVGTQPGQQGIPVPTSGGYGAAALGASPTLGGAPPSPYGPATASSHFAPPQAPTYNAPQTGFGAPTMGSGMGGPIQSHASYPMPYGPGAPMPPQPSGGSSTARTAIIVIGALVGLCIVSVVILAIIGTMTENDDAPTNMTAPNANQPPGYPAPSTEAPQPAQYYPQPAQ